VVQANKIKKAITWIRKSLEITEKTTLPGSILNDIRPSLDVLGWDRYSTGMRSSTNGGANTDTRQAGVVPADTMRLYLGISGETDDPANAFTHWLEAIEPEDSDPVALTQPVLLPVSAVVIRVGGLPKPLLMPPGGVVQARCSPATTLGIVLRINTMFVDIPLGEYMKSL